MAWMDGECLSGSTDTKAGREFDVIIQYSMTLLYIIFIYLTINE